MRPENGREKGFGDPVHRCNAPGLGPGSTPFFDPAFETVGEAKWRY